MFKKFTNKIQDTTVKAKQKIGKVQKTTDEEFEVERKRYETHRREIKSLVKTMKEFLDAVTAFGPSTAELAGGLAEFNTNNPDSEAGTFITASMKVDEGIGQLQTRSTELIQQLEGRIAFLTEVKKMIAQRDHLLTQYDAALAAVEKSGEDQFKAQQAQAKLSQAESAYESQNDQLKADIKAMEDWKNQDLVEILEEVSRCQQDFFKHTKMALLPLASDFDE